MPMKQKGGIFLSLQTDFSARCCSRTPCRKDILPNSPCSETTNFVHANVKNVHF